MSCSSWRLDASAVVSVSAGAGPCVGAVYYKQICKSDWAISRLTGGYIKCTQGLQPPSFFVFLLQYKIQCTFSRYLLLNVYKTSFIWFEDILRGCLRMLTAANLRHRRHSRSQTREDSRRIAAL